MRVSDCSAAGRHCSIVSVLRGIDCLLNTAHSAACMQSCSQAGASYEKIVRKSKISFFGTCKIFIYHNHTNTKYYLGGLDWGEGGREAELRVSDLGWPSGPETSLKRPCQRQAVPGTTPGPAQPIRSRPWEF